MNRMSQVFIAMGETSAAHFARTGTTGDWLFFPINTNAPNPTSPTMRYIVTPSDRFSTGTPDRAFPVGGTSYLGAPPGLNIVARNSDTAASGGSASFFWLAIDEGQPPVASQGIPLSQKLIGQPADFAATNTTGDHQVFPNIFNPPDQAGESVANLLRFTLPYSFVRTIGTTTISTFGTSLPAVGMGQRPLVFATANNAGCGVSPYLPTHNAAAVALVVDSGYSELMSSAGFKFIARNADVAGTCGFNWVALLPTTTSPVSGVFLVPTGAPQPLDLLVDTGVFPPSTRDQFNFTAARTDGDWASAEVQFNAPFAAEPVVLVSPQFSEPYFDGSGAQSSCAPVGTVQNVTRYGFTLAARNTDTNRAGGNAVFHWAAFGLPD
jgi:hypothetical protein